VDVRLNDMLLILSYRLLGMTEEDRSIKLTRYHLDLVGKMRF